MTDIEIIEQKTLSLIDVREMLEEHKKRFKELNFRSTKVENYVTEVATKSKKEAEEIGKKLQEAVPRLKEKHVKKVLDIMPEDINSLKAIFTGEAISLKQEE